MINFVILLFLIIFIVLVIFVGWILLNPEQKDKSPQLPKTPEPPKQKEPTPPTNDKEYPDYKVRLASQVGYNIQPNRLSETDKDNLIKDLKVIKPSTLVVLNDDFFAAVLSDHLPDTIVFARQWPDDNIQDQMTPGEFWNSRRAIFEFKNYDRPNLGIYVNNEPNFLQSTLDWLVEVANFAVRDNVPVAVGNWAVGNPEPNEIHRANQLLKIASKNPNIVYVGLHEYALKHWANGIDGYNKDNYPPKNNDATHWFMGRFRFWVDYCNANNIELPQFVITEW